MKSSKKSLRFIVGFVLSCAFLASGAEYSGTVVNQAGNPIENVLVSAGYSEYYTRTDANGRFSLSTPYSNTTSTGPALSASNNAPAKARWNFGKRTLDLRSAPGVNSASIYTINGKRVFGGKVPRSRILEVPSLAKGTYLLELRGEQRLRGRARVIVSNQATTSIVFGSTTLSGDNTRLSKSAQVSATSTKLIFRHDKYYPKDDAAPSANMSVQLKEDPRSFVFDQSKMREYRFTLSKEDSTYLDSYGWREEYVKAVMTFEGTDYGEVGLRYKGSNWTLPRCFFPVVNGNVDTTGTPKKSETDICAKISYKIKFTEYNKDTRLYGMKKINLHALTRDGSKMHDILAYELFRDMGIYAPRAAYANVYVNGKHMGLFLAVEAIDGRFTKSRWPDHGDGNLYKEVWPSNLQSEANSASFYMKGLKTNDDPEDNASVQRMIDYYNAIMTSNEQTFAQNLSPYMDFDYFLRYMAVDVAIKNWDGCRSWYSDETGQLWSSNHNYYFYEEENTDGKIWLVPWDLDNTFDEWGDDFYGRPVPQWNVPTTNCKPLLASINSYFTPPNCDKLTKLMASVYGRRYLQFGKLFLEEQFTSDRLTSKIDKHSALIPTSEQGDVNRLKRKLPDLIRDFKTHIGN